ncbi:MAG: type I DNA topoisomerase [bacterium]|nr:type I DNA topoisomerase [bacterium]
MSKNLVIVESPAKGKTIEKYLGKDFVVLSSVGHIRSIPVKAKKGTKPVDIENDYKVTYEVDPDKKKTIAELKAAVKKAETVWLATDEDREGEAIAWHLCEVLGLDIKTTKRIVFHEITKTAIEAAIKTPRTVDMNLVAAQQARQILDRIVGFELSPVVWRKVPGGKSAGRVQSPAVRLLVEREREIDAFAGSNQFKVTVVFDTGKEELSAELPKRFDSEKEANDYLQSLVVAVFKVSDISTNPSSRNPSAPFTTSTLQQEANSRLSFGARATMTSAQTLYQAGKITYMRTDSTNLSGQAIAQVGDYISKSYGAQYHQVRQYKTKNASAQEAHEAIRPTDISLEKASSNEYDQKLYDLIRRRTLASQMAAAKLEKTEIKISVSGSSELLLAKGEVVVFDGFLKVYGGGKADELLPKANPGDSLKMISANAKQVFARPPARYSEGSLVKKLEDLGIGRPSTYATIINTIQDRGYAARGENEGLERNVIVLNLENKQVNREEVVEKTGSDRGKLVPTSTGLVVSDFLSDYFNPIVDYGFTARVEEEFDEVAEAKLGRNEMLDEFYGPFHKLVEGSDQISRAEVSQAREVGKDPKSGKIILARFGRYGAMLQLGEGDDDNKPDFAPMPKGKRIETITLEEALKAFELPRLVGKTEDGQEIKANIGRFGPYLQVGKLFVSLKPPYDPNSVTEAEARQLYAEKLKAEAEKNISDFGDIKVLKGRFGPYITDGKKNAKIPKDTDPIKITESEAKEILLKAPAKSKGKYKSRKKS